MSQDIISPSKPDFMKFLHDVRTADKKSTSSLTKADERLALMSQLDGWDEFKKLCQAKIERLMSMRDYEAAGKDLAELGLRFLVADLVSGELESLISRVERARELYDEEQRKNN